MNYLTKVKYRIFASNMENLPKMLWAYPTDAEILNELQSEYFIESLVISKQWPKLADFERAVKELKKIGYVKELDPKKLKGKHVWDSYADLCATVKRFMLPKDPESMLEAIQQGKSLPMPIVVKRLDGSLEILGGATRSGIALLAGQKIKSLIIDEHKANLIKAQHIEEDAEELADSESDHRILNQVKDYYLKGSKRPIFQKDDLFFVHIAEFSFRKIAKLTKLPIRDWLVTNAELKNK
jgi:hypothetical protein